jgi:hypothetical protein
MTPEMFRIQGKNPIEIIAYLYLNSVKFFDKINKDEYKNRFCKISIPEGP